MNPKNNFFNFSLRQPVNQWLCVALICLMGFWTTLYYFTNKALAIGENLAATQTITQNR